jgi:hypothetical protein
MAEVLLRHQDRTIKTFVSVKIEQMHSKYWEVYYVKVEPTSFLFFKKKGKRKITIWWLRELL